MIEQYIFNKITGDTTLQTLLSAGGGKYHLYPLVVPRGLEFDRAVTFTVINTGDAYPNIKSSNIQFNIFAKTHSDITSITEALSNLFNEDNHQVDGGLSMIFSIRTSEFDIAYDYDTKTYQRQASYYFKIR